MPYNLHIIRATDFVRLDGQGKFDLQRSQAALAGLARACVERQVSCALVDIRALLPSLSTTDLYQLARAFEELGFQKDQRLAILHRYPGGNAEVFAGFASYRGWNVRAFENYEEAIEWFNTELPVDDLPVDKPN